ncbi:hypothetical protein BaRGS_00003934, partial [Batillaria attramentaria]
ASPLSDTVLPSLHAMTLQPATNLGTPCHKVSTCEQLAKPLRPITARECSVDHRSMFTNPKLQLSSTPVYSGAVRLQPTITNCKNSRTTKGLPCPKEERWKRRVLSSPGPDDVLTTRKHTRQPIDTDVGRQ